MIWFSFSAMAVGLTGAILILYFEIDKRRRGESPSAISQTDGLRFQELLDRFYFGFGEFFYRLAHLSVVYSLLLLRRLLIVSKQMITWVERRFTRLIGAVQEKQMLEKRGAASFFLSQLKEEKPE